MRAAAVDANQSDIVDAYRKAGATVTVLSRVGMGCPDLLVGHRGVNYLVEVKDGDKPPSAQKLTPFQVDWHRDWRGQVSVVNSIDAALGVIGVGPMATVEIPVIGTIS